MGTNGAPLPSSLATGVKRPGRPTISSCGGIANFGTLTVRDSTLLGNSAPLGGDLYTGGFVFISNSTIGDRYDA